MRVQPLIYLATNGEVRRQLVKWGILKFMENNLLQSEDILLCYMIQHWNKRHKVFVLHCCDLAILSETDIDFMMGLLPLDEVL